MSDASFIVRFSWLETASLEKAGAEVSTSRESLFPRSFGTSAIAIPFDEKTLWSNRFVLIKVICCAIIHFDERKAAV